MLTVNRVLFIPLSMLALLLGVGFRNQLKTRRTPEREQRCWPCGCAASYHDEDDLAAQWSPCDAHLGWAAEH